MNAVVHAKAESRHLLSGNEAVARAAWEAGVRVAAAYPGTPATEILENIALYPDVYSEWSVNEKVAVEVAIGASLAGSRALAAMKHVGMNVASDAFMTQSLAGVVGGLVIVVADDVGLSSSQNEQDSRYWGRFGHMPILEPADSQEAYEMVKRAFDLSEAHETPVIVRMTTRVCHVKAMVVVEGERIARQVPGFQKNPQRWVMTPANAKPRLPLMHQRDRSLRAASEHSDLNIASTGGDRRIGFITSGPAFMHVRETFPNAPVLKLGFSHPAPLDKIRAFASQVDTLVVVEETEPLLETEIRAAGLEVHGKNILPRFGELAPGVLRPAIKAFLGEPHEVAARSGTDLFPRPPTMCASCPHLGPYFALSHIRNLNIIGDIGCYTLGAGHPWNALDTCISMGASLSMAHGMDKGRGESDDKKSIVAVIGDSTFLHMGMQGLLNMIYNRGNVTVLLLDNRSVGMTGGQENPGTGQDLHGLPAPRVDFAKLAEALGVRPERIRLVDPYELPTMVKLVREETKMAEPSVIITNRPCSLTDRFERLRAYTVLDDQCTGCGNCIDLGCPAISVARRETVTAKSGKTKELVFARIDPNTCTGCHMCVETCAPDAIVQPEPQNRVIRIHAHA
ncbi:MAG: 4Fe-4S dicluster domain-containing protein [Candidatus Competibacteraceae bacterium]|nr:4Fe-4S dicluster domain-containing protein [Candidatus Competibacteraceae bacterium]MBK8898487.1 4Fe-4S dicluster domain-containing protein [Candidatus Competibacteraceae bacterium]MBK9951515.1 4Fe-4S dicluster domain-containing protein [Candidatus Competibacteraceae bacterium]